MLVRLVLGLSLLFAAMSGALAADQAAGLRRLDVTVPERGASIAVDLWYPAPAGETETIGASPIFTGVAARPDAPFAEGKFPLVLLAHGGLRSNPQAAFWIAARLASAGYIVTMPRPPALAAPQAAAAVEEYRLRPADLRAALSAVESVPDVAAHRMSGKARAVGFFLGATSVLQIAGARLDPPRLAALCDVPVPGPDCRWFAASGVDVHRLVGPSFGADQADPRIGAIVVVDPELEAAIEPASLGRIDVPVTFLHLGRGEARRHLMLPELRWEVIREADAHAAFGLCTERAVALLKEEGEDEAICREGPRPRAALHDEIAARILAALARHAN